MAGQRSPSGVVVLWRSERSCPRGTGIDASPLQAHCPEGTVCIVVVVLERLDVVVFMCVATLRDVVCVFRSRSHSRERGGPRPRPSRGHSRSPSHVSVHNRLGAIPSRHPDLVRRDMDRTMYRDRLDPRERERMELRDRERQVCVLRCRARARARAESTPHAIEPANLMNN